MRIRIPLIIEESIIKQIDEIAGEKSRRASTIETALSEFIARERRKAKTATPAPKAKMASPAPKAKRAAVTTR